MLSSLLRERMLHAGWKVVLAEFECSEELLKEEPALDVFSAEDVGAYVDELDTWLQRYRRDYAEIKSDLQAVDTAAERELLGEQKGELEAYMVVLAEKLDLLLRLQHYLREGELSYC